MSIEARLDTLGRKHAALETALSQEMRSPAFNEDRVHDIKRRKLAIKDEIRSLETRRGLPS
ncbi:YdcH family protein [Parvularcula dongshanensis]|uniref:DUF465 domain-containing protein n=1 Tax=Parvularcula dongshanensis TaxID=1173995 RepID=A0A840I510_9PROT|nr:DUF465 domain-containing protein [Parvularcula dongshanensis]MBB4659415.1 hypothetical protein [Parvularcula dongshanensis]